MRILGFCIVVSTTNKGNLVLSCYPPELQNTSNISLLHLLSQNNQHNIFSLQLANDSSLLASPTATHSGITKQFLLVVFLKNCSNPHSIQENLLSPLSAAIYHEQLFRQYLDHQLDDNSDSVKFLKNLYESFQNSWICKEKLNGSVDISLNLSPLKEFPVLRPYHALLLLVDVDELIESLPDDTSPLLLELIKIASPTRKFEELQNTLDCSLSQVYRLSSHLVYWQKAKIVHVISPRNMYIVKQDCDFSRIPQILPKFQEQFPTLDFFHILSQLSTPKPYSAIMQKDPNITPKLKPSPLLSPQNPKLASIRKQQDQIETGSVITETSGVDGGVVDGYSEKKKDSKLYLDVIIFLLKEGVVERLYTFIYLKSSKKIPNTGYAIGNEMMEKSGVSETRIEKRNKRLSRSEDDRRAVEIKSTSSQQRKDQEDLFQRLLPYFTGEFHIDEIKFRENLTRKEVKSIL
ncbi:Nitrogen permease regulator-like 3, partial [Nowakowskiella sp. JEL0407]